MTQGKDSDLVVERVKAALGGDREAFVELYRNYDPEVRTAVATALRFRPTLVAFRDDIVAEVWARLAVDGCKRLQSFDPSRGTFGYYLRMRTFAYARMIIAQYLRRSKVVEMGDPFISTFGTLYGEDRLLSRDALEKLDRAVHERLTEADSALFDQVFVRGRPVADVAEELGLTLDATYRRSHRLKKKVAQIAKDLGVGAHATPSAILMLLIAFCAQSHGGPIEENSSGVSELRRGDR